MDYPIKITPPTPMMSNNRGTKHTIPQYLTIPNIMNSQTPMTKLPFFCERPIWPI